MKERKTKTEKLKILKFFSFLLKLSLEGQIKLSKFNVKIKVIVKVIVKVKVKVKFKVKVKVKVKIKLRLRL